MAKKTSTKAARTTSPEDRVVALVGKELFLRQEHLSHLRDQLEKAHGQVDTVRFDGASAPAAEVLDECRSFGLLAGHKLVVVDEADRVLNQSTRALFERYCEAPCEGATLVLRAEKWNRGKLDDLIKKAGSFIKCDATDDATATRWAQKRASRTHNVTLAPADAALLVERLGSDLGRIDTELAKLAPAADGGAITREAIVELVGQSREEEIWSIQAELLSGSPERALGHLRRLLDNAPKDAAVPITFACTDLARKLAGAGAGLSEGANPGQLARDLKLWGPAQRAVMQAGGRMSAAQAGRLLAASVDADAAQKSGLGRSDRVLERLAVRFTEALARS